MFQQIAISAYWFATNFLWGALLVTMLPDEARNFAPEYKATALGILTGLSSFIALVVPLIVGPLSDRCVSKFGRRRPYIAVGVGINLIGLALMAQAFVMRSPVSNQGELGYWSAVGHVLSSNSFLMFLLAYMVVQLGNNIASAAYSGIIPDLVPENQRGRASGYMALMSQFGTLAGGVMCMFVSPGDKPKPPATQAQVDTYLQAVTSAEVSRYIYAGIALGMVALITLLFAKEGKLSVRPAPIKWGQYIKSLWIDPRVYPDFAWVWITRALVMFGFYSVLPFVNYYFNDVIGIPEDKVSFTVGIFLAVVLLTSSISGILGGYISDRIGRKRVVYIANGVIALTSIAFIFCHDQTSAMIAGAIFGLGFGAYTSVDWALGTDVLPSKRNAAKEMAIWHVAMTLPQAFAAPLAGFLVGSFGVTYTIEADGRVPHYELAGYEAMFIMVSICFAAGAYLLKNVRGVK